MSGVAVERRQDSVFSDGDRSITEPSYNVWELYLMLIRSAYYRLRGNLRIMRKTILTE